MWRRKRVRKTFVFIFIKKWNLIKNQFCFLLLSSWIFSVILVLSGWRFTIEAIQSREFPLCGTEVTGQGSIRTSNCEANENPRIVCYEIPFQRPLLNQLKSNFARFLRKRKKFQTRKWSRDSKYKFAKSIFSSFEFLHARSTPKRPLMVFTASGLKSSALSRWACWIKAPTVFAHSFREASAEWHWAVNVGGNSWAGWVLREDFSSTQYVSFIF